MGIIQGFASRLVIFIRFEESMLSSEKSDQLFDNLTELNIVLMVH